MDKFNEIGFADAIKIDAIFRNANKVAPVTGTALSVPVYFISNNKLYKGEYHNNENYYAYKVGGSFDCFASKNGHYKGQMSGTNEVCSHWCYVDELQISLE